MSTNLFDKFNALPRDFGAGGKGLSPKGGNGSPDLLQILRALKWAAAMPLPPPGGGWVEADGTVLAAFADGASVVPGLAAVGAEVSGIRWNNHATPDPVLVTVPLPANLGDFDLELHLLAAKTGATLADATTFTVGAFFNTVGTLYDADATAGGATSAMVGDAAAKTVQEVTLTIAAANVPSAGGALTLTIQPTDGTLGTDDVILIGGWIEIVDPST